MRFAHKRYYIEAYVKCANCGVLIYDDGVAASAGDPAGTVYCTTWCRDWAAARASGGERPLPQRTP